MIWSSQTIQIKNVVYLRIKNKETVCPFLITTRSARTHSLTQWQAPHQRHLSWGHEETGCWAFSIQTCRGSLTRAVRQEDGRHGWTLGCQCRTVHLSSTRPRRACMNTLLELDQELSKFSGNKISTQNQLCSKTPPTDC